MRVGAAYPAFPRRRSGGPSSLSGLDFADRVRHLLSDHSPVSLPSVHPTGAMSSGGPSAFGLGAAVLGFRHSPVGPGPLVPPVARHRHGGHAAARPGPWPGWPSPSPKGPGRASPRSSSPGQSAPSHPGPSCHRGTVGALVLLCVCKSVAYGLSLSGFRGGPVFPAPVHRRRRRGGRISSAGLVTGAGGGHGDRGDGHRPCSSSR